MMERFEGPEVIDDWILDEEPISVGGTRGKDNLKHPETGEAWFIKYPKDRNPEDEVLLEYEILTEYFAANLAKALGYDTSICFPAWYKDRLGLACKYIAIPIINRS